VNGADKLSTSGQSIAVHGVLAQYHCYKSLKQFDLSMMNSFCQLSTCQADVLQTNRSISVF